ncbi:MAG: SGNH/GDSL hydrolase family protein [Clostridium sp.]|nr:SGNH/GDSL hydrolase family protein [Bacteroides sp.]MCM1562571.1 SGNH/GDSL hydrolase family protein [Clostridium sp.]
MKKIIHLLFILVLAALVGVGVYKYVEYQKYAPLRADYERIATEDYNAVFFSTFPIDNFTEEDFITYREIYPLKASYHIPDMETLNEYFLKVSETLNEVTTVYLGVRPDIVTAEDLLTLISANSEKRFEVLLAYPSLDFWQDLDEEEYAAAMSAYTDFIRILMADYEDNEWLQARLSLYFYGSTEWLVGNSANYESDYNVNAGISHVLSMYSDQDHGYLLTADNYEEILTDFETLVSEGRNLEGRIWPDFSDWDFVFFGDSIIAFSNTSSIPGAFGGITGAHVYNCGQGGYSAARHREDDSAPGVTAAVDAFLAEDLSPFAEDSQIYAGMSDYFEHGSRKRKKCFVLDFGMNDYFIGAPVSTQDPLDPYSYTGALRSCVEKLQEAYPDAVIVMMTPNFTSYFGNGLEAQSAEGGLLPDYVAAVLSLCEEKDLLLYDSYNRLPIDSTNHTRYLLDGCHPNESTRYLMAQDLAKLLRPLTENAE